MEDIKMIISEETLKENQKKELSRDRALKEQKRKTKRKEILKNCLGVLVFYLIIIASCLLIEDRYNDLCKQGYINYCNIEK